MNVSVDYFMNGRASGDVASTLLNNGFDVSSLRPFTGKDERSYVTVNGKSKLVANAPATLRKDDWIHLDTAIIKAAKPRLRAWGDLMSMGLRYNIPNGMGHTVLQHQDQSDITPATISMDGLRKSESDRPVFDLKNLPLPIIHKDFHFSAREIAASRNGGSPLDTSTAELASRRVAEEAEKLTVGTADSFAYGGGSIYGYVNYPNRLTKSLTDPADGGWTPAVLVGEVLAMKAQAQAAYHYGPYMLYFSTDWDQYLDDDYSSAKGDNTLRERLAKIDGVQDVKTLDYLPAQSCVLVQMTSNVVRGVVGMNIVTVQWESHGGFLLNFKVMAILVPQLRSDQNDKTGIVHGSYS